MVMKLDEDFRQSYITHFKGRQHDRRDVCLFAEAFLRTKLLGFASRLRKEEALAGDENADNRLFMRGYNQCVREINREIETILLNWGIEAPAAPNPSRSTSVQ